MQAHGLAQALANTLSATTAGTLAQNISVKIDSFMLQQTQPWASLPPAMIPDGISGVNPQDRRELLGLPVADIMISCGRQTVAPALFLKNWPATSRFIHLLHPRVGLGKFDLVVVPAHDFANKTHGLPANVIPTLGALNRLTPDILAQAYQKWHPLWAALPAPKIAVLLGGTNSVYNFDTKQAARIGAMFRQTHDQTGASFLVTTSRRTDSKILPIIRQFLAPIPHFAWAGDAPNPYFGLLACADHIIVTADSINMVSEACFTGKPVYIMHLPGKKLGKYLSFGPFQKPDKFAMFHQSFATQNYTRKFTGQLGTGKGKSLDEAARVAKIICQKFYKT